LAKSILSDNRLKVFFAVWWLTWLLLHYIILNQLNIPDVYAVTDSVVNNCLLASCCFFISNNMKYYLPRREKYWYILGLSLMATFLWMLVAQGVMWLIFNNDLEYSRLFHDTWGIRFGAGYLLISSMNMLSLFWYSQEEQKQMERRKIETEELTREAELFKLRQQLQPHFLFNSLNSISALTGSNPSKARYMIQQLSDFLRGTLKKEEQQWNSLEEELQYLNLYLEIEKVRFGHRLQTEIIFDNDALQMKLPALILQPVVENAIKFGLYDTTGDVLIRLTATLHDNRLAITVSNPFDPQTALPQTGTGFGLSSIERRLFLLFGRHGLLETKPDHENFITSLYIPQFTEEIVPES
jgi:two-component system, LytTR family, sensor kinase